MSRPVERSPTSTVSVPEHVVFRELDTETIVLDVESGEYYGLNATGGRMLAALREQDSIAAAFTTLGQEFEVSEQTLTTDLTELCNALRERGLIVVQTS